MTIRRSLTFAVACLLIIAFSLGSRLPETTRAETHVTPAFHWPEGKRAALSLSFDDARPSQIDQGLPLLERYGVKVTFYVSPANLKERMEGWKRAASFGCEIGNHSLTHPCSGNFPWSRQRALEDFTLETIRKELTGANAAVVDQLGVTPKTFAYPCGQKFVGRGRDLKSYVPLVAELFTAGRGWLDEAPNDPLFCDMAQIMGVPSDNLDFGSIKPLVDHALEQGLWLVLAGHDIGTTDKPQTTKVSMLEDLFRYAQDPARGLWVDTVQNVAAYIEKQRAAAPRVETLLYLDPGQPLNRRVEDLLARMTLEEKVGQMNMPCVYEDQLGRDTHAKTEACRKFVEGTYEQGIGPGGGFFTLANTILQGGSGQQAQYFNELQKIALEKTRLKIPLLETEEGTHGAMCSGKTVFPEGLALGSTWNIDLLGQVYSAAAGEARAVGIHQLFTLVVEPNRDPRLGRNQEGYSEDPFLCSRIAETIVASAQGDDVSAPDKVVAGLCHYPGQSQPASGLERGAMEISERTLREVFLPPWVAGIRGKGALGVMATYPAIDGVPVHASDKILTGILRQELGFDGLVLSEGSGISTLIYEGLAPTQKIAGELALKAGVDVGISYEKSYMQDLVASVKEGRISMDLIDRSVRRILKQKFRLGLFKNRYVDPDRAVALSHTPANEALALRAAREGIVLLKNEKELLPLSKNVKSIAVIGPNADNSRNQLGDYAPKTVLQKIVTVLEGIRNQASGSTKITYVKGCEVIGEGSSEIARAREAAKSANVAVVVVGENEWDAPDKKGTDGEGYDVASLDLTGQQEDLVKAVYETGTPTVVVLINGRPLSIRWIAEHIPAIVEAWIPGEQGGRAVADVLFGDSNPSGRLSITVPRHSGQLPAYYNYKPSKAYWLEHGWGKPYADMNPDPLFEFGYGLSYTRFEYSNLQFDRAKIPPGGKVTVSLNVTNTGKRRGEEVVQLYIRDLVSSVTTPVKQLRGFEKVGLEPGETKSVRFTLGPEHLSLLDRNLKWIVEPGTFSVMIGSSSKNIRLTGTFDVVN
ncbi:MAG TPA: glycoside hydrolase family 3 C-terminal domain-containing protein [Acidobacteriota bacterium]|nr:glycoside hydrolase family 3 C-terminal domain-containing protein [Acidobacteriota bacterium]